ncbi:hypothetical protein [Rhodopirellula baltica]|uniref:hypothetical protein n=1 Tax=Rhodopirellula baltica TaxID=265606 RepID=UPI0002D8212E|nr:hypothetical protein [Rhodopirellula baltica]
MSSHFAEWFVAKEKSEVFLIWRCHDQSQVYGVLPVNFCRFKACGLAALLGVAAISGCGGSSEPEATSTDELTQFLNENPELKEPKPEVSPSDPTKP